MSDEITAQIKDTEIETAEITENNEFKVTDESEKTTSKTPQDSDDDSESGKYKDGEILDFVRVRFPGHAKSYAFLSGKRNYLYGQKVLGMSDRGMAVGYINSFPYKLKFQKSMLPIRVIERAAEKSDEVKDVETHKKEKDAQNLCLKLIEKHKLDMDITHVEFTQYGKKAVFYFVAPHRVDFRGLVKDLVSDLKLRIELRQISIRDRAAALGGIGPCGRQLCCSSFLSSYGKVNIKMAKNQNLSLIPSRLNGLCGQLKCCTQYENEVYSHKRKLIPESGKFTLLNTGEKGKVLKTHVLIEQFEMLTDEGKIKRYTADQWSPDNRLPKDWKFPERFDFIVNETKTIIGLKDDNNISQQNVVKDNFDNVPFFDKSDDDDDDDDADLILGDDESSGIIPVKEIDDEDSNDNGHHKSNNNQQHKKNRSKTKKKFHNKNNNRHQKNKKSSTSNNSKPST